MTLLFLFLLVILFSWLSILHSINSFGFKLGSIEFGSKDLMLLFKNLSVALPVISCDTVEFISNTISLNDNLDNLSGDFLKLFLREPTALSAKELDCGWYAELCLCLTLNYFNFSMKLFLNAPPESDIIR